MTGKPGAKKAGLNRRDFLKSTALAAGAGLAMPAIVPASVFGANAPSNRIQMGCIGTGRIARTDDIPGFLRFDAVQIVAVCDVDSRRVNDAKAQVEGHYAKAKGIKDYQGCDTFGDYRALIARPDIDAVMICTPDHWHALPGIAAAQAGKDLFIQKPLSLTIAEGRALSDAVHRTGRVLLVGSQQRSHPAFRRACEGVRNGRIGELKTVRVGLPGDPGCGEEPEMSVPENLNYDLWLGSTPEVPYTEKRVHPQKDYSRPGWLRIQAYGAGMITGWGSHHLDTAQWGMGTEYTGPVTIEGKADFPESGLWDVHGDLEITYTYADGRQLICADSKKHEQGVRFEGTEGWIHVRRWEVRSEPDSILESEIGADGVHLYKCDDHKRNFIDCVRSRGNTVAPVEVGHRSNTVCLLGSMAMNLGRKLEWDPGQEQFKNDDEANRLIARPMRAPWKI